MSSRLKSLELHGYKTFASRTTFEFPGMVTAIVGPNGSGKSNIADSIRWVLGEQSFSLLRGRKTEDMIYNGSELRPKAGMASSSITFNNEDGWLPIDFTEVTVTRRAYRDGDNEYLLNGQRVRLKDISELLAKSGLAERTYTIIGQGLVDAALSLKPEERRKFFEEAAGIGLYRSRREESLTRLETTRRNLERVQDILGELGPRMNSLERQARKAIEYDRITADLRLLLRDWYGYHWHKVQQDVIHAAEVVRVQEGQNEAARDNLARMDDEAEQIRGAMQTLRSALNAYHAQLSALHDEQQTCSRQMDILDERKRAIADQSAMLETELARLEEEQQFAEQKTAAIVEELESVAKEARESDQEIAAAEAQLRELENQAAALQREIQAVRQRATAKQTEIVQKEARISELESRLVEVERSMLTRKESITRMDAENEQLEQRYQAARADLTQVETQVVRLEGDVKATRQELERLSEQRKTKQAEIVRLNGEVSKLTAQRGVLERAEQEMTGVNKGARLFFEAQRKAGSKIVPSALARELEVPREYEVAVAAALGDLLDGIVLSDAADIESALSLVEDKGLPRAAFFSLDWPMEKAKVNKAPAGVLCAADLIAVKSPKMGNLARLLANVFIVETRAQALALAAQLPAGSRVVTGAGEVFTQDGQIFAGKVSRLTAIARPREIKELAARLAGEEKAHIALQAGLAELNEAIASTEMRIRQLGTEAAALDKQRSEASRAVQAAELTRAQNLRNLEALNQEIRRDGERKAAAESNLAALKKEILAAKAESDKLAVALKGLNRENLDLPLNEIRERVNHWRTQGAVAGRALKEIQLRSQENATALASIQGLIQKSREKLTENSVAAEGMSLEKSRISEQSTALNEKIAALDSEWKPRETELIKMETALAAVASNQQAAQQGVTLSERRLAQAQLELARQRESLDSLKRKIEDDFGLVALEFNPEVAGQTPLPFEGMVEMLPNLRELPADLEENIARNKSLLRRLGYVNLEAQAEYYEVKERFEYLTNQVADLRKADLDLREVIAELDELMRRDFKKTFTAVAAEFKTLFTRLFGGGSARLVLTDEDHPTEGGIDIEARLPGRREQGLSLLSGGERSLTAVALVFALLKVSPTPFCVLDEVDAMLDEANVGRFCDLLKELASTTQFIVITHNRNTVQVADVIYGITMGRDSASQMIGLRLDELSEDMVR